MNINKYSVNILLKLALIFSLIFGVFKPVLASGSIEDTESMGFFTILKNLNLDLPIFITLIILLLSWYFNKNKQQKQLSNLVKNQNKIIGNLSQLNELNNKLNNLDRIKQEIIKQVQDNNQKITDLEIRLHESLSKQQVNQPISNHGNVGLYSNNDSFSTSDISTTQQLIQQPDTYRLNPIPAIDNIPEFVKTYNLDKDSLSDQVRAVVTETEESITQRRSGNSDTVILENTTDNKYWIIEEGNDYHLVPHAKIKINKHNIKTLESLFECVNSSAGYSDFQLIQPAKVSQLDSELWQLDKKGKLNFS